jgi:hypothetical protein
MPDYLPKPDVEFAAKAEQIIAALEADEAAYGVLPANTLALRTELNQFTAALADSNAAKAASTIAVGNKDTQRADVENLLRPLVQQIQVNPNVTDAQRSAAGIPVRDTSRSYNAPIAPRDLVATADGSGTNTLKWNANGNTSGIQYVIEAKIGTSNEFVTVDVRTQTTYNHTTRTVGQPIDYRVRARRGENVSAPSNIGSVHR